MSADRAGSAVADWRAARHFPDTYPGECPPGSFIVIDERVHDLVWEEPGEVSSLAVVETDGTRPLDDVLAARGLAPIGERVPVIAYGGNRNPGTIALKCVHYDYRSPGTGDVFPAVRATLRGMDIVGAGLTDQGYLYADVHLDEATTDTEVSVWVLLLDHEGLRVMHDSEGVREGAYVVADVGGLRPDGWDEDVAALCYVGMLPVFRSPVLGSPVAYATVAARGRALPEMDATAMVEHMVGSLGLESMVAELTGIPAGPEQAAELIKYLNGQFWYRRHTGRRRLAGCERLEAAVWKALATTWGPTSSGAVLAERGVTLDPATAYEPGPGYTIAKWWA